MRVKILPLPLFILTCISLLFSAVLFALALFSYGVLSVWLTAATALFTIIYHGVVVVLSWRRRLGPGSSQIQSKLYPSVAYSAPSITCAFFVWAMWIVSIGIAVELTLGGPATIPERERNAAWNNGVQAAESVLMAFEGVITAIVFVHSFRARRRSIRQVKLSKLKGKGKSVALREFQVQEKQPPPEPVMSYAQETVWQPRRTQPEQLPPLQPLRRQTPPPSMLGTGTPWMFIPPKPPHPAPPSMTADITTSLRSTFEVD